MHYYIVNRNANLSMVLLLFSLGAIAGNKNHVTVPGGIVHLRGMIENNACTIDFSSKNKEVDMGTVPSSKFSNLGEWSEPVPFTLKLTDCNTALHHEVKVMFSGVTEGKDPLVFSAGNIEEGNSAEGIGIGLFTENGNLIVPNSKPQFEFSIKDGVVMLPFVAKYRSTSRTVSPGNASADVNFSLFYP